LPHALFSKVGRDAIGGNAPDQVPEDSLSRVRRTLEKQVGKDQEILMIRFSKVDDDEVSGFLKTRNKKNEVFLTDFAAKTTPSGTIEYLKIGEKRIRIARGNRAPRIGEG